VTDALAPLREQDAKAPANPYGDTKLAAERLIASQCRAYDLTGIALRYFNAAGADASGLIGEGHDPETHLIPLAIAACLDGGTPLTLFGDDFETPDGTCVRDYIHVNDLAAAHVAALEAQFAPGTFEAMNVGSGTGHSVRDVIETVGRLMGRRVPHTVGPRRAGDPASLVADPAYALARMDWTAAMSSLEQIVADAIRWESNPAYGSGRRATRSATAGPPTGMRPRSGNRRG